MLSRFSSRIILIAAATPLTAVVVHSQSPPLISQMQRQNVSNSLSNASVPVCYIQLENGQVTDLRRLCGKKAPSPVPFRSVPRPAVPPGTDDDDEPVPTSAASPQAVPSPRAPNSAPTPQATPTRPTPQPSAGSLIGVPGRSTNVQPSPAVPSSSPPASPNPSGVPKPSAFPNPLAIPEADDARD